MVLKGTNGRKTSRRQDDSAFREALAALLESPDVELTRRDEETGSCQKLARLVEEEARKNANGAPQTFYFLHENGERFLVVAPTATVLLNRRRKAMRRRRPVARSLRIFSQASRPHGTRI